MGAELLKFRGFFDNHELLKDFYCGQCKQAISEQDISQKNYQLWVSDYANEVEKSEFFSDRLNRHLTCYNLTFWLKEVEHEECPETERCQGCYEKFRIGELKEKEDYFWCKICQPKAGFTEKEMNHE